MDNQPAPVSPETTELPAIPTSWPGPFGVYKYSKAAVKVNLEPLLLLALTSIAVSLVLSAVMSAMKAPQVVSQLVTDLVGGIFSFGTVFVLLGGIHRTKVSYGEAVQKTLAMYVKVVILYILYFLAIMASVVLLIVPFFFVFPRIILSFYFLADKNMGPVDALKASWEHTKGNVGKVYGIIAASIAMILLMITIIGIPFALYFLFMYSAAAAVLYGFIGSHASAPAQAPLTDTAPQV